MTFSKVDKEILLSLIVVIAILLLASFIIYNYLANPPAEVKNLIGGAQTQIK